MSQDLPDNLRLLCSYHPSIAEVCRQLNINRSQFNRYLNGKTQPTLRLMRRICDFFGVEEAELLMPHRQFKEIIRLKPTSPKVQVEKNLAFTTSERLLQRSIPLLDTYIGYYFIYYHSLSKPGKIIKGFSQIFPTPYGTGIKTLEMIGTRRQGGFTCKYEGMCFMLGDRIFITALETLTHKEAIQLILYPNYTNRVRFLSGIYSGVGTRAHRPPSATRVVLQYLGANINVRRSLAECGLFTEQDERISEEIYSMIQAKVEPHTHLLEAAPN